MQTLILSVKPPVGMGSMNGSSVTHTSLVYVGNNRYGVSIADCKGPEKSMTCSAQSPSETRLTTLNFSGPGEREIVVNLNSAGSIVSGAILDEAGGMIFDEAGNPILEE